eukprot:8127795-Heterocapsa_arctica.AAC.1
MAAAQLASAFAAAARLAASELRYPTVGDLAAVIAETSRFSLVVDIMKAHCQGPVCEDDWGQQAC